MYFISRRKNEQLKLIEKENQVIKGTEIDFVVKNSLKALELYKEIFDIEVVEATDHPNTVWFNIAVEDIEKTHKTAKTNKQYNKARLTLNCQH